MTASPISAARALELGLVNRVVAAGELDAAVQSLVETLCALSPSVLGLGKRAFYDLEGLDEPEAYARATEIMVGNAGYPAAREGIAAFLEKRRPEWPA